MKRLIVSDLDGTLLNDEKEISLETKEVLIDQQERGATLILASGRTIHRMMKYAKELKMDEYGGYLIEANGAAVYDFNKNERIIFKTMEKSEVISIHQYLKRNYPQFEIMMMADTSVYLDLPEKVTESYLLKDKNVGKGVKFVPFKEVSLIDEAIFKVAICKEPDDIAMIRDKLEDYCKEKYNFALMMPNLLELSLKDCSKGKALSTLMEKCNYFKEDTYVFGDNENDLSMFECGQAVAMNNATNWIKQHADNVTLSNNEDGIAYFLKKLPIE